MIYVDPLFVFEAKGTQAKRVGARHGHRWSHMWCDPGEEEQLLEMAAKIGMKREWFQPKDSFPHYDLVPTRRAKAIKLGAVEKSLMEWLRERRTKSQ